MNIRDLVETLALVMLVFLALTALLWWLGG